MKSLTLLLLLLFAVSPSVNQRSNAQSLKPSSGLLNVSSGNIYYEYIGKGPPIVFIHGGYGDRRMWDGQFLSFATGFQVIRYDHRGFGRSSPPQGPYSPVEDLLGLLDKLNVSRAYLVGNSMGGSLAIDFALRHPERVASLVIVASGPRGMPVPQKDIDRVVAVFKAAESDGPEQAVELWLAHPMVAVSSRRPGVREHLRTMVSDNRAVFRMKYWPSESMDPPAAQRLEEISAPTLVVIGGQDTEVNRMMGEEAAKHIRGARKIVMAGSDHLPQMIDPPQFNRYLRNFLQTL